MKFGQLIVYNMSHIFLEKSYTKYAWKTSPRLFSERLKLNISLDQQSKFLQFTFKVCSNRGLSKYIENIEHTTWFYVKSVRL